MPDDATLAATFAELSELFAPYRSSLIAKADEPDNLYLETPPSAKYPAGLYFGAVKIGERYVSFHLMPVYTNPELLENISPALRKRMQGKSCFNFTRPDPSLFSDLASLTAAGFNQFRTAGLIPPS